MTQTRLDHVLEVVRKSHPEGETFELLCAAGRMSDALRWLSTIVTGPGGYPRDLVQRIASEAAKGGHWRVLLERFEEQRRQLPPGRSSGRGLRR